MSFIGNFASAASARAIGKYNSSVIYQEAQYVRKKAEVNKKVFENIDKPRLIKKQNSEYDALFVNLLKSGVQFRPGETAYLVGLETKINQATDLAIAKYNAETAREDLINRSLLLEGKAAGEMFKGKATATAETIKGFS